MDVFSLETLEYPAVLKVLEGFASSCLGKTLVRELRPLSESSVIDRAFKELHELDDAIKVNGTFSFSSISDLRPILKKTGPEGAYLIAEELQTIRITLEAMEGLRSTVNQGFEKSYPRISSRIKTLTGYKALLRELNRILDEKARIKDSASRELGSIRKGISSTKKSARALLTRLSTDKRIKDFLQDESFTIRDDRYVIGVKVGGHVKIPGVIHGKSATGATYFIEPFELVEVNNTLSTLKNEEKAEEVRILKRVTATVLEDKDNLLRDLWAAAELDLVQAKALFSKELRCVVPELTSSGEVKLKKARHPLLILKETKTGEKAVPVDIIIEERCRVLVISGANTGGKTVALKTLGLLTLMVQSAIPVPVEEGSRLVLFKSVFADIGDRQDILASLSTFSSHVKQVGRFLELSGPGSLVLIDEIGVGTDPAEGAVLALTVLETLKEKGAVSAVTTHLNLLKAHAQIDPSFQNASVDFDEKTLKPLYNLSYGVPGPSLGLSIARSHGLAFELVEKARARLEDKESAFLESIRALEEEKEKLAETEARLKALELKRAEVVERFKNERGRFLERGREKVEAIVKKAEEEIRAAAEKFREEGLRGVSTEGRKARVSINEAGAAALTELGETSTPYVPEQGDTVELSSSTKGVVINVDGDERKAELAVGNLKVWVPWDRLRRSGQAVKPKSKDLSAEWGEETSLSINLIGKRADEATRSMERFLDSAHVKGLQRVEVIHGLGTGALKKALHDFLKESKLVKSFFHPDTSKGGSGVTIVELL